MAINVSEEGLTFAHIRSGFVAVMKQEQLNNEFPATSIEKYQRELEARKQSLK